MIVEPVTIRLGFAMAVACLFLPGSATSETYRFQYDAAGNTTSVSLDSSILGGTFSAWDKLVSLPVGRRGPLDRNGPLDLPNLVAYALGISPLTAISSDLPGPKLVTVAGDSYLEWIIDKNPSAADAQIHVEYSETLGNHEWVEESTAFWVLEDTPGRKWLRCKIPTSSARQQFVRLRVTLVP